MTNIGGFIIGLQGYEVTELEQQWLEHPLVVGVILFSRNYRDKTQLLALTESIRSIDDELVISVDHEGGRVQRFREGFTRILPMNTLEALYNEDAKKATDLAYEYGQTIAQELRNVGVDFSYAPVCDINYNRNDVIGDRSFHSDSKAVTQLVGALYDGLKSEKSIGVAKHFPGHGYVAIDTHLGVAYDDRPFSEIEESDLQPFKALIRSGIEAVMPAHIIYTDFDADHTAVSSSKWMDYLRNELGFQGLVISDDLDMKGADHLGTMAEKAQKCFDAGVDILLCCNDFHGINELLMAYQSVQPSSPFMQRMKKMRKAFS